MSALSNLSTYIEEYKQLPHHSNPELAVKLEHVQSWQKDRIRKTHAKLFAERKNQPMADYFLEHLYGGDTLKELTEQLERIVPKARKLEKYAPSSALETGVMGIRTAITSTKLDLNIAKWLLDNNLEVNEQNMLTAYQTVDEPEARREQIRDLKDVCYRTDKYLSSFVLQQAFKLTKKKAYQYNLHSLYDFIAAGFAAMKPLKSVGHFIEPFCERELEIIEDVH